MTITSESAFVLPPLAKEPLHTALTNVNAVWLYHSPPLVQGLPADDFGTYPTAAATYLIPVTPSADGLPYLFKMAFTASKTVTRTYYTSTDTAISGATYSSIGTVSGSTGASGLTTDGPYTISASTTHIKITISTASTVFPMALCVYPDVPSIGVRSGAQPSGFVAYDDGVLNAATGAPIHKEFFDRCRQSSLAVWHDRRQNCYSLFANTTPNEPAGQVDAIKVATAHTQQGPIARIRLPGYTGPTRLSVKAIAATSGATVSGAIAISAKGKDSAALALDASGSIVSGDLTVTPEGGGLESFVDVSLTISGKATADVTLYSLMIWPEAS